MAVVALSATVALGAGPEPPPIPKPDPPPKSNPAPPPPVSRPPPAPTQPAAPQPVAPAVVHPTAAERRAAAARRAAKAKAARAAAQKRAALAAGRREQATELSSPVAGADSPSVSAAPYLIGAFGAALLLFGLALTPATAVPWSRASRILEDRREEFAVLGAMGLLATVFFFLLGQMTT